MPPLFRRPEHRDDKRFFALRGCMKSGTNWLCNLVNLHPAIHCHGEFHWERIWAPMDELTERPLFRVRRRGVRLRERMERVVMETLLDFAPESATVVGDRTPWTIDPVILPGSKQLTIQRDGRDVLISRAFHFLAKPHVTRLFQTDEQMGRLLQEFQRDEQYFEKHPHELLSSEAFVRQTGRLWHDVLAADLATIRECPELEVCVVRYEDLHEDIEAGRRRVYEFLGVEPEDAAPLDELTTPGFKVSRPREHYRLGRAAQWKKHMTSEAESWFMEEVGGMLEEAGYTV